MRFTPNEPVGFTSNEPETPLARRGNRSVPVARLKGASGNARREWDVGAHVAGGKRSIPVARLRIAPSERRPAWPRSQRQLRAVGAQPAWRPAAPRAVALRRMRPEGGRGKMVRLALLVARAGARKEGLQSLNGRARQAHLMGVVSVGGGPAGQGATRQPARFKLL